ncbi:MAG: adenylyl-sulfate kinase [Opitutales bacterium]|nr:adenylyl-sulfate kinase [Opitutales bacterium]MCH8539982.1 adenylyl-sulfate kinase [Opitutales bacterium]
MKYETKNLFPTDGQLLSRQEKEKLTGQKGLVVWLVGLSGSGKSTLANALDRYFFSLGRLSVVLDGDNVRTGLNANLGFSEEDREENLRRVAEVSKLFVRNGLIVINAFITPLEVYRKKSREILGSDLHEIYVRCSFEACRQRDVKGLYAKAAEGKVANFTGKDSSFEEPEQPDLVLDTEELTEGEALEKLVAYLRTHWQT